MFAILSNPSSATYHLWSESVWIYKFQADEDINTLATKI